MNFAKLLDMEFDYILTHTVYSPPVQHPLPIDNNLLISMTTICEI